MSTALLSSSLFAPLAVLVAVLALAAPLQLLLMLDLLLAFLPGQWMVGGVRVDPGDLVIAGIFLALTLRGRWGGERGFFRVPGIGLWLVLGAVLCLAYLVAPDNQQHLDTPLRIAYQLYRYCWRPILYYPFTVMLLGDSRRAFGVLDAVLLGGDVCAAIAVPQGYHGLRAAGPFDSPNTLGAVLVVPMLIAVAGLLAPGGRWRKLAYGASLLLLGRAMLFCGSRGALMAVCLGAALLLWQAARHTAGRQRLMRFAPWVLAGALAAIAIRPGLLHGPNLERFLTLAHPMDEETFQWRMKQRWPHFWHKVEVHPWLGVGTYVDLDLGTSGNTPHNGYLAIAVTSGLPALALYLGFGGMALWRVSRRLKRSRRASRAAARAPRSGSAAPSAAATHTAAAAPGWTAARGHPAAAWATRAPGGPRRWATAAAAAAAGQAAAPSTPPAGARPATGQPAAAGGGAGDTGGGAWLLDALVAAALAGLLVHNFDDTVVLIPAIGRELWLLVGLAMAPPLAAAAGAPAASRAARRTAGGGWRRAAAPVPAAAGRTAAATPPVASGPRPAAAGARPAGTGVRRAGARVRP